MPEYPLPWAIVPVSEESSKGVNFQVSRCCGLRITREGFIVTMAKNNHNVLVLNTLFVT